MYSYTSLEKYMATSRFDVVSIGTLSRNILWHEKEPVRTAHATTTLIRTGKKNILIDPGLPGSAIAARLYERSGLKPHQIDIVFLTNFQLAHRGGISAFPDAKWYVHELEREAVRTKYSAILKELPDEADDEHRVIISRELEILDSCKDAPDKLVAGIDLFPLFGYTAGTCGLLLTLPTTTVLIAGDAVPTQEHFLVGQVLPDPYNLTAAKEALQEVYDIADVIIPGHDNVFQCPRAAGM